MVTLFFVIVAIISVHFVYDRILLPGIRQNIRIDIFELRDELRREVFEAQDTASKQTMRAFEEVDAAICHSVNRLHLLTLTNIGRDLAADDEKRYVDRLESILKQSDSDVPKKIAMAVNRKLALAFLANSLLAAVWFSPIAFAFGIYSLAAGIAGKAFENLRTAFERFAMSVISESEADIHRHYQS